MVKKIIVKQKKNTQEDSIQKDSTQWEFWIGIIIVCCGIGGFLWPYCSEEIASFFSDRSTKKATTIHSESQTCEATIKKFSQELAPLCRALEIEKSRYGRVPKSDKKWLFSIMTNQGLYVNRNFGYESECYYKLHDMHNEVCPDSLTF